MGKSPVEHPPSSLNRALWQAGRKGDTPLKEGRLWNRFDMVLKSWGRWRAQRKYNLAGEPQRILKGRTDYPPLPKDKEAQILKWLALMKLEINMKLKMD